MSNQPIALGGPAVIALGPTDPNDNNKNKKDDEEKSEKPQKTDFHWADEVRINDETVITIPVEHLFYEEEKKTKRKSRWGEKPSLKNKVHQDVVFNPYQALTGGSHLLPITDGRDVNQTLFGTTKEDKPVEERKRVSKWGPDWEKSFQPPIYNNIPRGMSIDDVEYLIRLHRLDEITRNLNLGELEMGDADIRSPSPDPIYDKNGVRVNTRIIRAKEKLIREKSDLIEECAKLRKTFVAPADYKPPKKSKKIFLPESDGLDNQYIGRVLGPKGVTQKALEGKTGCKISIRGKGSSKQKRAEYDSDEKLHVLIQADTDEAVESGAQAVEKILRGDIEETTEAQKAKMLQVAAITSALGDDFCSNCSEPGHKSWYCPNKGLVARSTIKCAICGDRSHPTSDCPEKKAQGAGYGMHHELASFMASLNGTKKPEQRVPETMGFMTNAPKPVLALTFGGTAMAYPQPNNYVGPGYGAPPAMNPYGSVVQPQQPQPAPRQPQPLNAGYAHSTTESTITRPPAYSMPSNTAGPYFINPMMMNYIPQNMQGGNQASNVTIMPVNPNQPMGMTYTGMSAPSTQPGTPSYPFGGNPSNPTNSVPFQGYSTNIPPNNPYGRK